MPAGNGDELRFRLGPYPGFGEADGGEAGSAAGNYDSAFRGEPSSIREEAGAGKSRPRRSEEDYVWMAQHDRGDDRAFQTNAAKVCA